MKNRLFLTLIILTCLTLTGCIPQEAISPSDANPVLEPTPNTTTPNPTESTEPQPMNSSLPWIPLVERILKEEYNNRYTDLLIYNLEPDYVLLGIGVEMIPDPNINNIYNWYELRIQEDSFRKIEGQYDRIISYQNNTITSYDDGQFGEINLFTFPSLHQFNTETEQYNHLPYYARLADRMSFPIGGIGQKFSLTDIENNGDSWDLHMQSETQFDGPPKGIISSDHQTVIFKFPNVSLDDNIPEISGFSAKYVNEIDTLVISIDTVDYQTYNCEIEKFADHYWILRITLKE